MRTVTRGALGRGGGVFLYQSFCLQQLFPEIKYNSIKQIHKSLSHDSTGGPAISAAALILSRVCSALSSGVSTDDHLLPFHFYSSSTTTLKIELPLPSRSLPVSCLFLATVFIFLNHLHKRSTSP